MLGRLFSFLPSLTGLFSGIGGYAIVGLVAGVIGFTGAWKYQAATYGEEISGLRLAYAEAATEGLRRQAVQRAQQDMARNDIDIAKTRELEDARSKNDRLARAVAAGAQQLRVAAQCPAGAGLPGAAAAGGLDHGGAAELAAAARPDYFALRAGIERQRLQLEACQGELRLLTAPAEARP